jgi:hypothetical protein
LIAVKTATGATNRQKTQVPAAHPDALRLHAQNYLSALAHLAHHPGLDEWLLNLI